MAISKKQPMRSAEVAMVDLINTLESSQGALRFGVSGDVTVSGNSSATSHVNFDVPFSAGDSCIVFAQAVTDGLLSPFTVTVTERTHSGFSFSVSNSDADEHTVKAGYIAVKVEGE